MESATPMVAFWVNICFYSAFPLYFTTVKTRSKTALFYIYISVILVLGGIAGAVYSFPLSENLVISGGNLAYGAFMMSTIMLIIIEHNMTTFLNMIRLVIIVDLFVFLGFNLLAWLLESGAVVNPLQIPSEIFHVSFWVLILGGILILLELLFLLFIFLQARKVISNISLLSFLYTAAFIFVLCVDGVLFPLLAFGLSPELTAIIFGNVQGKIVMASCYSLPMLVFYFLFRRNFVRFIETPLQMKELVGAPRKKLLAELYRYEIRDQQLRRDKEELAKISTLDALTALANRRKFDQTLDAEWFRCQRSHSALTLVIGDIDFFKQYNDYYGHQQGDECLKTVAALWNNIFKRPTDLAARVGGEEFAIILPETSPEQSLPNLEHFLNVLESEHIPHAKSTLAPHVTMSIGVAGVVPARGTSAKDLFALADQRLYRAKHEGRNRIIAS